MKANLRFIHSMAKKIDIKIPNVDIHMSEQEQERLSLSFYRVLSNLHKVLAFPTHATLEKSFKFSLVMFACTGISALLGYYTFITWYSALACTLILLFVLWRERAENDAIIQMYKRAKKRADSAKKRARDIADSLDIPKASFGRATYNKKKKKKKGGK